ncbi:MAG TPA: FG-GAP-like repeat-containing protein [Chitinophagaceae bacterium]|jgi:hypothetical protein|nr:FG-GAP-like repeat-containing protein [Chitinophagaceae bacterium]
MKKIFFAALSLLLLPTISFSQGSFSNPIYFPIQSQYPLGGTIKSADFNNDGKNDLVYIDGTDSCFRIFLGQGNGQFNLYDSVSVIQNHGMGFSCIFNSLGFVEDFNGDGYKDIVLTVDSFLNYSIRLFLNDGNGKFPTQKIVVDSLNQYNSLIYRIFDITNDGFSDIICYSWPDNYFYSGDGTGNFTNVPTSLSQTNMDSYSIENNFIDINNDGKCDFINCIQGTNNTGWEIYYGTGVNTFQLGKTFFTPYQAWLNICDVNKDSLQDIYVRCLNHFTSYYLINDNQGNFTQTTFLNDSFVFAGLYCVDEDFNEDAKNDIACYYGDSLFVCLGDGFGQINNKVSFKMPIYSGNVGSYLFEDMDNDNKTDLVYVNPNPPKGIYCLLNQIDTTPIAPSINISPISSGSCGYTSITFFGNDIEPKMHLKFTAAFQTDIEVPDSNITYTSTHIFKAHVDFSTATIGKYNIVLTDSNGIVTTITDGFEVQATVPPDLEIKIIGPSQTRIGLPTRYYLKITNPSNCNALAVPIVLFVSGNNKVAFVDSIYDFDGKNRDTMLYAEFDNYFADEGKSKGYMYLINQIYSKDIIYYPIDITALSPHELFTINVSIGTPFLNNDTSYHKKTRQPCCAVPDDVLNCVKAFFDLTVENAKDCATEYAKLIIFNGVPKDIRIQYDLGGSLEETARKCIPFLPTGGKWINRGLKAVGKKLLEDDKIQPSEAEKVMNACKCRINPLCDNDSKVSEGLSAHDPNDKVGIGVGIAHWINGSEILSYGIHFENVDTASASAQVVILRDTLDITKVDIISFKPELITIGNHTIDFSTFKTNQPLLYDMRPAINLIVKMEVSLDSIIGALEVIYTSLDPTTMLLTTDPLLGFLPPNINKPTGEGSFYYSVKLKAGLSNNTIVKNTANIYFDFNPPILTPTWINTIDILPPTSKMNSTISNTNDTTIYLSWKGSDVQSGVQKYDIFYSENGGAFIPYITNFANDSILFYGKAGSGYSFYTIAVDNVGNREIKSIGDVSIRINEEDIQIFPNPSTGEFTVQIKNDVQVSKLALFDMQGHKVPIAYKKNNNTYLVQVPTQQNVGTYVLKIVTADKSFTGKILIQK